MYRAPIEFWYLERIVWLIAGLVVLTSTILGLIVTKYWFILTALAGMNMLIFAFTGYCPMAIVLHAFGVKTLDEKRRSLSTS